MSCLAVAICMISYFAIGCHGAVMGWRRCHFRAAMPPASEHDFPPGRSQPVATVTAELPARLFQEGDGKGLAAFLSFHDLHRHPGSLVQSPYSGAFENRRMHEYVL